jgi:hypothetical protein
MPTQKINIFFQIIVIQELEKPGESRSLQLSISLH